MALTAVIPVNWLDRAKGRLATLLEAEERRQLAVLTLETVLTATREAGLAPVLLTPEPEALLLLDFTSRETIRAEDPGVQGLNAQLEAAVARLDEVLILHADLPLCDAESLRRLLAWRVQASATLVESSDGGTNAMVLRPPGRFPLRYGPGSCEAHKAAAGAAGIAVTVMDLPGLRLDLDTPDDLRTLLASREGRASPAGRYLASRGVEARLRAL